MLEVAELKPDGKSVMGAKAFAAGVQGIKQGGFTWTAGPAGGPQGSAT
jgi:methionyl-tRNA formyltransferase